MLVLLPLLFAVITAAVGRAQGAQPIVDLGYAKYRGSTAASGVTVYYGLPYAEPPVRSLRFRAPKPLDTARVTRELTGQIVNATQPPQFCVQGTTENQDAGGAGSEDCLKVNVYTPAGTKPGSKLPVLFYIHGGDFIYGNPVNWPFESWIQQSPNVVIVSVYYRLDSFGFLSHPSLPKNDLNAGFQDQIQALRWVKAHIASFGGDPTKITIDGHSAGAASVELHLVTSSGMKEKLFRAAIAQSISRRPLPTPEQQRFLFDFYASAAGCNAGPFTKTLECLQSASISALARAQDLAYYNFTGPYNLFHPVVDGALVKDYPTNLIASGEFSRVPLMVGATSNETFLGGAQYNDSIGPALMHFYPSLKASSVPSIEALYPVNQFQSMDQRFTDATGDSTFRCGRTILGSAWAAHGLPSYTYRYNQPVGGIGATITWHSAENWLMFNGTSTGINGTTVFTAQNAVEKALSSEMIAYWLSFVRSGNSPNTFKLPRSPAWPAYQVSSPRRVVFQANAPEGSLITSNITVETEPTIQIQRCKEVERIASEEQA